MDNATEPPVTWKPTPEQMQRTQIAAFIGWVNDTYGTTLSGYRQLWEWSVDELSLFWEAIVKYFDVLGDDLSGPALPSLQVPAPEWFPGSRLNFAENVLRAASNPIQADTVAIHCIDEDDQQTALTWRELAQRVASLAAALRGFGVQPGERVAAVLPNIPEAIIGLLAAASIGATWTINSPELPSRSALNRLRQLEPVVLIGGASYRFAGKHVDGAATLGELRDELPSVRHGIVVAGSARNGALLPAADWHDFGELCSRHSEPHFERVPFDHPLWVLFSSGTTGLPKGIVHGHGGITLEAIKSGRLNHDMGPGDLYYVGANTSWTVWNILVNSMLCGAAVVTYPGSPTYPHVGRQFDIISRTGATTFATGAAYLSRLQQSGAASAQQWDLSRLRQIVSTGSPLAPSTWQWMHDAVKADVHLGSDCGGTEISSAFIGSNPLEPVRLGELQGPLLGVAVQAWSEDGTRVVGDVGEMVITRPTPSMPVSLWNDHDGQRYHSAFFARFPGVWTQGDWITETDRGSFVVHGRSDATLNRFGVRLGSGDIYSALEHVPEVLDGLVIGVEEPDAGYYMPLFVVLASGCELDEPLKTRIAAAIKGHASARHVPDEIIAAPGVPMTHTLKKAEIPVKKLFAGHDRQSAISTGAIANPDVIDWYVARALQHLRDRASSASSASTH